jgi:hypothetical protein
MLAAVAKLPALPDQTHRPSNSKLSNTATTKGAMSTLRIQRLATVAGGSGIDNAGAVAFKI